MTEQGWEYCSLYLQRGFKEGCWVEFHKCDGNSEAVVLKVDGVTDYHVFNRALAALGAVGWELTSVQYGSLVIATVGNTFARVDTRTQTTTLLHDRVGYLKRHIQPGRAVTEPKLCL